jgi:hypothetical protein
LSGTIFFQKIIEIKNDHRNGAFSLLLKLIDDVYFYFYFYFSHQTFFRTKSEELKTIHNNRRNGIKNHGINFIFFVFKNCGSKCLLFATNKKK